MRHDARRVNRVALLIAALLLVMLVRPARCADENVKLTPVRLKSSTLFIATLDNCTEATLSLDVKLVNMRSSIPLPCTIDTAGRQGVTLCTISPIDLRKPWTFTYTWSWKPGRRWHGGPVPPWLYALPFTDGPHRVVQAALGAFSHGPGSQDEQAIDWEMPVGSTVCAARGGVVTGLRSDVSVGGNNLKFKPDYNYVVIRHDDGTFAEYVHLEKDGVLVRLGQRVETGESIGLSGMTGYASGPHLHFAVFYTVSGKTRVTLPIRIRGAGGQPIVPVQGAIDIPGPPE